MEGRTRFRLPAEFEPQRALWLAWPTYRNRREQPTEPLILEILTLIRGRVQAELLVQNTEETERVSELLPPGIGVHPVPHGDIWMRDTGPIFLVGDGGQRRIVEFGFNMWGYEPRDSPASLLEGSLPSRVAERLGIEVVRSPLVSEGGAREGNGEGTLLVVEAVERQRNPDWTLAEMEAEYRRVLGVRRVLWLAEGLPEDQRTTAGPLPDGAYTPICPGGHVDEFARFADPETVLLAEFGPEDREQHPLGHERMEENRRRLGDHFRVLPMPVPDPIHAEAGPGDGIFDLIREYAPSAPSPLRLRAAASYLNFLITNGLVLAPRYWKPGLPETVRAKDEVARRVLRAAFPGREILGIDPLPANFGGGGIHCMTQQEPLARPLY